MSSHKSTDEEPHFVGMVEKALEAKTIDTFGLKSLKDVRMSKLLSLINKLMRKIPATLPSGRAKDYTQTIEEIKALRVMDGNTEVTYAVIAELANDVAQQVVDILREAKAFSGSALSTIEEIERALETSLEQTDSLTGSLSHATAGHLSLSVFELMAIIQRTAALPTGARTDNKDTSALDRINPATAPMGATPAECVAIWKREQLARGMTLQWDDDLFRAYLVRIATSGVFPQLEEQFEWEVSQQKLGFVRSQEVAKAVVQAILMRSRSHVILAEKMPADIVKLCINGDTSREASTTKNTAFKSGWEYSNAWLKGKDKSETGELRVAEVAKGMAAILRAFQQKHIAKSTIPVGSSNDHARTASEWAAQNEAMRTRIPADTTTGEKDISLDRIVAILSASSEHLSKEREAALNKFGVNDGSMGFYTNRDWQSEGASKADLDKLKGDMVDKAGKGKPKEKAADLSKDKRLDRIQQQLNVLTKATAMANKSKGDADDKSGKPVETKEKPMCQVCHAVGFMSKAGATPKHYNRECRHWQLWMTIQKEAKAKGDNVTLTSFDRGKSSFEDLCAQHNYQVQPPLKKRKRGAEGAKYRKSGNGKTDTTKQAIVPCGKLTAKVVYPEVTKHRRGHRRDELSYAQVASDQSTQVLEQAREKRESTIMADAKRTKRRGVGKEARPRISPLDESKTDRKHGSDSELTPYDEDDRYALNLSSLRDSIPRRGMTASSMADKVYKLELKTMSTAGKPHVSDQLADKTRAVDAAMEALKSIRPIEFRPSDYDVVLQDLGNLLENLNGDLAKAVALEKKVELESREEQQKPTGAQPEGWGDQVSEDPTAGLSPEGFEESKGEATTSSMDTSTSREEEEETLDQQISDLAALVSSEEDGEVTHGNAETTQAMEVDTSSALPVCETLEQAQSDKSHK